MTILELIESFKKMNRPGPTVVVFNGEILSQSSFKSSICAINIWDGYL